MATKHGSKAVFLLRDGIPGAGSMRSVYQYMNNMSLAGPIDTAEVSTYGAAGKKYVSGLEDHTFPMEGPWNPDIDEWLYSLISASAPTDFQYAPAGSTTGNPSYSGSAYITSYQVSTGVDGAVTFSAAFQVSGSVTRAML